MPFALGAETCVFLILKARFQPAPDIIQLDPNPQPTLASLLTHIPTWPALGKPVTRPVLLTNMEEKNNHKKDPCTFPEAAAC